VAPTPLETDALIVGAGPTGLMLATVLVKLGVRHILIDGKSGPTTESRALGVQARTMEIYEQLGLVEEVLAEATRADAVSPGYGAREFAIIRLANLGGRDTRYPYVAMLEQSKTERMLVGS